MELPKLHKGIFCFLNKKGYSIHDMRKILTIYAISVGIKRPKKDRLDWYADISNKAEADFVNFKKVFNKNKAIIKPRQSYNDWWNSCNLDGSFAYNGVTEDF